MRIYQVELAPKMFAFALLGSIAGFVLSLPVAWCSVCAPVAPFICGIAGALLLHYFGGKLSDRRHAMVQGGLSAAIMFVLAIALLITLSIISPSAPAAQQTSATGEALGILIFVLLAVASFGILVLLGAAGGAVAFEFVSRRSGEVVENVGPEKS